MLNYVDSIFKYITHFIPEIFFVFSIFISSVCFFIVKTKSDNVIFKIIFGSSVISLLILLPYSSVQTNIKSNFFVCSYYTSNAKFIIMSIFSIFTTFVCFSRVYRHSPARMLFMSMCVVASIMFSLSSNNFLTLVISLEAYGISIVFLIISSNDTRNSLNSGIRYLFTSAFFTGIFLYGASLCYSCVGSLSFNALSKCKENLICDIGISLALFSILFKMAIAPFHMWSISIYHRSSTAVIGVIDLISKTGLMFVLIYFVNMMNANDLTIYKYILFFCSILSMVLGPIGAIRENNIKSFIAYSAIGHTGFALSVITVFENSQELKWLLAYLMTYIISSMCFFSSLLILKVLKHSKDSFEDIKGIGKSFPFAASIMAIALISMMGLPPFTNFFAKLGVLMLLLAKKSYLLFSASIIYTILTVIYSVRVLVIIFTEKVSSSKKDTLYHRGVSIFAGFIAIILTVGGFWFDNIISIFARVTGKIF